MPSRAHRPSPAASAAHDAPLCGVVLAGGLSSRLGHDKALVRLEDGQTADLLARTVQLLRDVCGTAHVIGRSRPGYSCIPDREPGCGPVGGIMTALATLQAPCLILSCDLPFMDRAILERLLEARNRRPENALMTGYRQAETGHKEALVAVYEHGALPFFTRCVEQRLLKISLVVPHEQQYLLPYNAEDSLPFFNINYPADLELARRMMSVLGKQEGGA